MPIGEDEQGNGVYYYGEAPFKNQSNAVKARDLWHERMGHPFEEVMKMFAKKLDFSVSENNDVYDACFRAKQTRMQFHLSENKAEELF